MRKRHVSHILAVLITWLAMDCILAVEADQLQSDTELRGQIIGDWSNTNFSSSYKLTIASNGSFVSQWIINSTNLVYYGIWQVHDGVFIMKQTNVVSSLAHSTNGSESRSKIICVNAHELAFTFDYFEGLESEVNNTRPKYHYAIKTNVLIRISKRPN